MFRDTHGQVVSRGNPLYFNSHLAVSRINGAFQFIKHPPFFIKIYFLYLSNMKNGKVDLFSVTGFGDGMNANVGFKEQTEAIEIVQRPS